VEVILQRLKEVKAMNIEARRIPGIGVTGLFDWIGDVLVIVALILAGGWTCGTLS
jgi:hypothetical protein